MKENLLYIQQQQFEKLKELGTRLQQFRQEQSVSLEDVAAKTRIQIRLLKAIEEGRREELPEPVYIKGFIKQFADALGLDGSDFVRDFPTWYILPSIKPSWLNLPTAQLRPIHLYFLYIFLVVGAVNSLSYMMNHPALEVSKGQGKQPTLPLQGNASQSQIKPLEKLGSLNSEANSLAKQSKSVRVGVTMKASSWVRVVADGKTLFEGDLPKGTQLTWVADEQLTVRADNAGSVLVAFNNEKAKKLGAPGEEQEVTFAANSKS